MKMRIMASHVPRTPTDNLWDNPQKNAIDIIYDDIPIL